MNDGIQTTMPVQPAGTYPPIVYGNNGNNDGFGGNNGWWVIILLLALGRGWGGYGGGNGGGYNGPPYIINTSSSESGSRGRGGYYDMQDGFNHAAVMAGIDSLRTSTSAGFGDTALGISGLGRQICETGSNITSALNGGFYAAEIANGNRAMAAMQRSFDAQTAVDSRLDSMAMENQRCCCETKAQIADVNAQNLREHCQDRYDALTNTRDIIENANRNNQTILDKLCQLELDTVKTQLAQAQRENVGLQNQLNMATLRESQTAQNAFIAQGLSNEVDALYNRLSNCPVPSVPVYGRQPIFNCQNNGCGCGCGN